MALVPFHPCTTMCIAGATSSGKTYWMLKFLRNLKDMYETTPPVSVLYCYTSDQTLYQEMEQELQSKIKFHKGIPSEEEIDDFSPDTQHRLIVLDDLMREAVNSQTVDELFRVKGHHRAISVIWLTQNLLSKGKYARDLGLNSHYYVIMKNMRNRSQIAYLGRQIFPQNPKMVSESFEDCMKEDYGYLVIDLFPQSNELYRLRSHIFPGEDPVIYRPSS